MKICLFIVYCIIVCNCAIGQTVQNENRVPNDSIINGIFDLTLFCDVDTTIIFHDNSKLLWEDTLDRYGSNYSFEPGNDSYYEVVINTQKCRCSDCAMTEIIIIRFDNLETNSVIDINPTNSFWMIHNVWRIDPFEEHFRGILDLNRHRLQLNPTLEGRPEVFILPSTTIDHPLLTTPN